MNYVARFLCFNNPLNCELRELHVSFSKERKVRDERLGKATGYQQQFAILKKTTLMTSVWMLIWYGTVLTDMS
jgi:hypothetical protein